MREWHIQDALSIEYVPWFEVGSGRNPLAAPNPVNVRLGLTNDALGSIELPIAARKVDGMRAGTDV